jgi:hypothetical protein
MIRKVVTLGFVVALTSVLALACDKGSGGGATDADGGKIVKQICKMNNQCWICPDEAAMKKCIINPATSGCKLSGPTECL